MKNRNNYNHLFEMMCEKAKEEILSILTEKELYRLDFSQNHKESDLSVLLYEDGNQKIEEVKIKAIIRTPNNTLMLISESGAEISPYICAREDILELHEQVFTTIENLDKNNKKISLYALYGCDAIHAYNEHQMGSKKTIEQEIEERTGGCYEYIKKVFNTEDEMAAYIDGARDMSGWGDFLFLDEEHKLNL